MSTWSDCPGPIARLIYALSFYRDTLTSISLETVASLVRNGHILSVTRQRVADTQHAAVDGHTTSTADRMRSRSHYRAPLSRSPPSRSLNHQWQRNLLCEMLIVRHVCDGHSFGHVDDFMSNSLNSVRVSQLSHLLRPMINDGTLNGKSSHGLRPTHNSGTARIYTAGRQHILSTPPFGITAL